MGCTSRTIETADVDVGQTPFFTDHKNVFVPLFKPETLEVVVEVLVIAAVPVIVVQVPLPTVIGEALIIAVEVQIVWLIPA